MPWRGKRKGDKPEQRLAAATIVRTSDAASAEVAVRSVLARAELERPLGSVVVVDLDAEALAAELGGLLEARLVQADAVGDADAAVAVASSASPAVDVVTALEPIQSVLLGVVLVEAASAELDASAERPAQPEAGDASDALAALAELERAAGARGAPPAPREPAAPASSAPPRPSPSPSPPPAPPIEPPSTTDAEEELARRLTELTHREAALRRMVEAIEKQRSKLEEREQALERALEGSREADERLAEVAQRAAAAEERAEVLEREVGDLREKLDAAVDAAARAQAAAALPPAPPPPVEPPPSAPLPEATVAEPALSAAPPTDAGAYTLQRLEKAIADAQLRGDPQAEEWVYYLPLLREHASFDGRIPAQFDSLIGSVFGSAAG